MNDLPNILDLHWLYFTYMTCVSLFENSSIVSFDFSST